MCTGILLLFFHPKLLWVDTCYCHIGLVAATFPQDTVRRAIAGSENLKVQDVIQGLFVTVCFDFVLPKSMSFTWVASGKRMWTRRTTALIVVQGPLQLLGHLSEGFMSFV